MNKLYNEYQELALNVLKPSKRELEHGLELHKNALVWDAYGFTPYAVPDLDAVLKLFEAGAGRDEFTDFRENQIVEALKRPGMPEAYREVWETSGVDCIFLNSGIEGNNIEQLIKRLARSTYMCDRYPEVFTRAAFPEQVVTAHDNGKHSLYLTTNGVPLPQQIESVESALYYLTVFFQLGVRMMHLTYNRRNLIGDGCAEPSDAGLSGFGRQIIDEMNRIGVIPDVAHSGLRTSFEAAQYSKSPVVASHTVAGALSSHYRAKNDEVIREIVKSGGYVGICCYPVFFRGTGMIDSFLDHIDYVAESFGTDAVAIGSDNGSCTDIVDHSKMDGIIRRPIFEQYWTPACAPFEMTKEMFATVAWTNWPLFTVGLVQRGYSDDDIRKIIGGNVLRVCRKTLELANRNSDKER